MNRLKTSLCAAGLALTSLLAATASYSLTYTFTTHVDHNGTVYPAVMTGASGVEVNGFLYDVTFYRGQPADLYWELPFEFDALTDAMAAGQALLDQVFVDDPNGEAYDSLPGLAHSLPVTWAQGGLVQARQPTGERPYSMDRSGDDLQIAYGIFPGSPHTAVVTVKNDGNEALDGLTTGFVVDSQLKDWAVFERTGAIAPVPLPASLLLLGAGLGALGLFRRRR